MKGILGVLLPVLLCGCASQGVDDVEIANISITDDILFYDGELNEESVALAIDTSQSRQLSQLNIRSYGGEITSAMRFATWIRSKGLDVEINEICFSSCANYIFPAGRMKYVSEKDLIGWHGGAYQKVEEDEFDDPEDAASFNLYIVKAQKQETALFQYLGVNPALPNLGQQPGNDCQTHGEQGWYYSVEDLKRLGVDHVVLTDGQWEPLTYHAKDVCQLVLTPTAKMTKVVQ